MTHRLSMVTIGAKLFRNLTMDIKLICLTRTLMFTMNKVNIDKVPTEHCDLDLWVGEKLLLHDMLSIHSDNLCQIVLKSDHACQTYRADTNTRHHSKYSKYWLSSNDHCDLDLCYGDMVLARDTSSFHVDHFCQIILKSDHAYQSYGFDTNTHHHYK